MTNMSISKIIFYNQWRNGDCFLPKQYVRDIVNRHPFIEFQFAHNNHPNIVSDLPLKHITLSEIPQFPMPMRMHSIPNSSGEHTLYINTWVGCFIFGADALMGEKDHANFYLLHKMWTKFYDVLGISMVGNYTHFLPEIKWDTFDLTEQKEYLKKIEGKRLIFFSNGKQQSEQSSMGNMQEIIRTIAEEFKDIEFYVTDPVNFEADNVTVCNHETGVLNQLAYITTKAELIVGKNSGPFTYAHNKDNINNYKKTFMCFSHKKKDCLLGEGEYLCNSYFSNTVDDEVAIGILRKLITNPEYTETKKLTKDIA